MVHPELLFLTSCPLLVLMVLPQTETIDCTHMSCPIHECTKHTGQSNYRDSLLQHWSVTAFAILVSDLKTLDNIGKIEKLKCSQIYA